MNTTLDTETRLADDVYSKTLARLLDNPVMLKTQTTTIDAVTLLNHSETWVVRTIRVDGRDTIFVQRNNVDGGDRLVLPPDVTAAIARQRDTLTSMTRRRGARRAVATRKAKGIEPAFLKNPHRRGKKRRAA